MERDQLLFRLFGKYSPEGAILYTEGSPGEELFLVQSGAVRLVSGGERGSGEVRGPGAVLGEEAFFARAPRRHRAEVLSDSRLLMINDRKLDAVVRHGPEVAGNLTERLLELTAVARGALEAWVLARHLRRAEPHLAAAVGAPLRATELAELAGLAPLDAAAVLAWLDSRGVLQRAGEGFRVSDRAALERAVREGLAAGEAA